MSQSRPMISVIIPVYNCASYLGEAIESALGQDYHPFEIVVIDDGSTDGTGAVVESFGPSIRYYYQRQSGAAATRNRGAELALGEFLAFLDADDVWIKDKLNCQMAAFEGDSQLDMAFGYVKQFISPELDPTIKSQTYCPDRPMPGYSPSTMLVKRESFFEAGLFDTQWRIGEFIDWFSKARERGLKSRILPEVVCSRRIHSSNLSIVERGSRTEFARILKAALDRRREHSS